jgi:hypothetical protein
MRGSEKLDFVAEYRVAAMAIAVLDWRRSHDSLCDSGFADAANANENDRRAREAGLDSVRDYRTPTGDQIGQTVKVEVSCLDLCEL